MTNTEEQPDDYANDKLEAFMDGMSRIRAKNGAAELCAQHDVIYVSKVGLTDDDVAWVLALGFGWHDAPREESLGFFT